MEKENRNLKDLVIMLYILVLGLGGYLVCDMMFTNNIDTLNDKINNVNVGIDDLNEVLKTIGVKSWNDNSRSCLNYYLSNDNYSEYAQNIISYYRDACDVNVLKMPPNDVYSSIECGMVTADCYSISKEDASYLYNLYNLDSDIR